MTQKNHLKFKFWCLQIKLFPNIAIIIPLCVGPNCFQDTETELKNCDRDLVVQRAKDIYHPPFKKQFVNLLSFTNLIRNCEIFVSHLLTKYMQWLSPHQDLELSIMELSLH